MDDREHFKGQGVRDVVPSDLLGALETGPSASPQPFPSLPLSLSLKTLLPWSHCPGGTDLPGEPPDLG